MPHHCSIWTAVHQLMEPPPPHRARNTQTRIAQTREVIDWPVQLAPLSVGASLFLPKMNNLRNRKSTRQDSGHSAMTEAPAADRESQSGTARCRAETASRRAHKGRTLRPRQGRSARYAHTLFERSSFRSRRHRNSNDALPLMISTARWKARAPQRGHRKLHRMSNKRHLLRQWNPRYTQTPLHDMESARCAPTEPSF